MIKFVIYAFILVIALFILVLLGSCMLWVVMKLLRSIFPQKFAANGKRKKDEK